MVYLVLNTRPGGENDDPQRWFVTHKTKSKISLNNILFINYSTMTKIYFV